MQYEKLAIPDVVLLTPKYSAMSAVSLWKPFAKANLKPTVVHYTFVQDNHSKSARGILRGLHYQYQQPQGKLVRVTRGEVFDVAVDMRQSSPTFGQWVGVTLSEQNKQMLWVPPGFAHGFYVASEEAEFQYKCTDYYAPGDEITLCWNDPTLNIQWPLVSNQPPQLSSKDQQGLLFIDAPCF